MTARFTPWHPAPLSANPQANDFKDLLAKICGDFSNKATRKQALADAAFAAELATGHHVTNMSAAREATVLSTKLKLMN